MVTKEVGRRARTKAASRARIIESAIRLFGERGIDAVTVDEIAAAADVGKGTIYNYFRTKEDIVVAFMADVEQKVQAKLRELDTAKRPLADVLIEFITLQFAMKTPHHRFVRVFFTQMFARTEQFLPHMAEIHELSRATTASLFEALRTRRAIRADVSIEDLTLVFHTMLLGLSALWAIEGPPFHGTHHVLQREIALFCEGLEAKKR
jgi:AcrR family transcriptional regulator